MIIFTTLPNVVKLNVENEKAGLTLANVSHINVEIDKVDLTSFYFLNSNFAVYLILYSSTLHDKNVNAA